MPNSQLQSIRSRLENARRRHNRNLALSQIGYWIVGCLLVVLAVLLVGSLLEISATLSKILFIVAALAIAGISAFSIGRYLRRRHSEARFAYLLEERLPDLQQRLITSLEFEQRGEQVGGVSQQFIDQLYLDAQAHVDAKPIDNAVSNRSVKQSLSLAGATLAGAAAVFILFEPLINTGRALLWPWDRVEVAEQEAPPIPVAIHVEPGDVSLQRGDDLMVTASLDNASSEQLALYFQDDNLNWQRIAMMPDADQPAAEAKVFAVELANLTQEMVYYVEYTDAALADAEPVRSAQFRVQLFDLPRVEALSLGFNYPTYTGLENKVEDPGGDIVAPEGTEIDVRATLNKTVATALIEFDDGNTLPLSVSDKVASGRFKVSEDTNYRIRLIDGNDFHNKDPLDYYVRAIKDTPPEVALKAPGKDQRVMPLEEVMIEVDAKDDYGLTQFELNYSVIGVDDKKVDFLGEKSKQQKKGSEEQPIKQQGTVRVNGKTMVYLEDLKVQPGDIVSYSISVADNNGLNGPSQVISDIYFLEVIPTDHEFARAGAGAGGGGGGGGGGNSSALVSTQKDVIAATWKLRNRKNKVSDESFAGDGAIIRESQAEVAQRAQMSISRLTERGNFDEENYERAVVALQKAIQEMQSAIEELDQLALDTALQAEQRALQEILKAESQINKTDVAMNRQGGGGGGQQQEREDLRELFEMELGELENRYEMPQGQQQAGNQEQNKLLDKLKELAQRQERLTRSQRDLARREEQMNEEQKRQQLEQLRRQQEELRQDLANLREQMSQQGNQSSQQSPSQQSSSQQQSGQQASNAQSQGGNSQQRQNALQQLERAMEEMQQAASSESPSQAAAKSQKALDSLKQQAEQMGAGGQKSIAELQENVKQQASELAQRQRQLRRNMEELSRQQSLGDTRNQTAGSGSTDDLIQEQQELRKALDQLGRGLRDIASNAGEDESRAMEQAHQLARDIRPIDDKMETSGQILQRGMVNLSLKIESDIEAALGDLQRRMQGLGGARPPGEEDSEQQLANQVRSLRQELENLQRQAQQLQPSDQGEQRGPGQQGDKNQTAQAQAGGQQSSDQQSSGQQASEQQSSEQQGGASQNARGEQNGGQQNQVAGGGQQPNQIPTRQGERSGAFEQGDGSEPATRQQMQESLERSRQLAQGLVQMGRGGAEWNGSARSIESQLSQQNLQEFLNRPDLLRSLLQPVIELENQLRVRAQLNEIDNKLYSSLDEDVPEEYKALVETYYRVLSESKGSNSSAP